MLALARPHLLTAFALSVALAGCGEDAHEELDCLHGRPVAEGFETVSVTFDIDELEAEIAARPAIAARLGFREVTSCEQAAQAWWAIHPGEFPPLTEP